MQISNIFMLGSRIDLLAILVAAEKTAHLVIVETNVEDVAFCQVSMLMRMLICITESDNCQVFTLAF